MLGLSLCCIFLNLQLFPFADNSPDKVIRFSNLPNHLIFNFNDTYQEKTFNLHLTDVNLRSFNSLLLFFQVDGYSLPEGLNVTFIINTIQIQFIISKFFQDNLVHDLTETFTYPTSFSGAMDITVICAGQSTANSEGTLTILYSSRIEPVDPPSIYDTSLYIPFIQDWLVMQGEPYSFIERSVSTAFYYYNDTIFLNLTLSFVTNCYEAGAELVSVYLNDRIVEEAWFNENSSHCINILYKPNIGLNILTLDFSTYYFNDMIMIAEITAIGFPTTFSPESGYLDLFQWEQGGFNYTYDISGLKPERYNAEQVLHISLEYSCIGTKVSPSISYQFFSGAKNIGGGQISYTNQLIEHNILEFHAYTTEFHQNLYFNIQGSALGVGQLILFYNSTIETTPIDAVDDEVLTRNLDIERPVSAESAVATFSYYDVFEKRDSHTHVELAINFELLASYEYPFDNLRVDVWVDSSTYISANIDTDGFYNFSRIFPVSNGYHEVIVKFKVSGISNPFSILQLQYQVCCTNLPSFNPFSADVPTSVHGSILWLLGIYGIFFFLLVEKKFTRKNLKKEPSPESEGNQQKSKKKETVRFIIICLVGCSLDAGLIYLSKFLDTVTWVHVVLSTLISFFVCQPLFEVEFKKDYEKNFTRNIQEFFRDIDTFSDFIHKFWQTLKQKTTLQIIRIILGVLVFILTIINLAVLFFVSNKLQSLTSPFFLFIFSNFWQAYFLLYASMIVSTLFLLYVAHFVWRMAFVEDNLKRVRVLGKLALILVTGSLVCVVTLILGNEIDLSILWTSISPLMIVGISKTSTRLAKTLEQAYPNASNGFMNNGQFFSNRKEVKEASREGIETREEWEKEKKRENKNKLRGIIIWDIKAGVTVTLVRLAELVKLEEKETEKILMEVLDGTPSLGEYHRKEQVFIKKSTDNTSGTTEMKERESEKKNEEKVVTKEVIEWEGTICKGGGSGSGQITVPMKLREKLEIDQFYDLTLVASDLESHVLTAKFKQSGKGSVFYIPKGLCEQYLLIGKTVTCYIYKMEHFPIIVNEDKIVGLPHSIVDEYKLKKDDMWEVEVLTSEGMFREVILISVTDRSNRSDRNEYRFTLRLSAVPRLIEARAKFVRRIERLASELETQDYETFYLPNLFSDGILGKIHENEMIFFLGNHVPLFTPIRINLFELIHYFGCYYADGTKKGWSWRINASTPEQAKHYINKYNQLVLGNGLVYELTYTMKASDRRLERKVKKDLQQFWKERLNIDIAENRILVRKSKSKNIKKWNECGSLGIRDDRHLIMEIHLRMMSEIEEYLKNSNVKEHMWEFLLGILEGDGSVRGGNQRFGIGFSSHKDDVIIQHLLDKLNVKYEVDMHRVKSGAGSGIQINFWLFEVLNKLNILSENLFIYYPKRRRMFIERLLKQSTVRYLMGEISTLSPISSDYLHSSEIDLDILKSILNQLSSDLKNINNTTN